MRIGDIELTPGALLAPMEAVTDLPFRTVCEELGAALTFTEFLSAEALTRGAAKAIGRMWPSLGGRRFAVQIFGREPDALARAAGMAVEVGAAIVDINMGCPAKKVTAGACGSALMREPALAAELVAAVRRAVPAPIPVTVKHRAGWDESSLNAAEFARALVDAGAAMITVHGRTRAQGFSGSARMEPIASVRAALPREIPVIGNGDVKDVAAYQRMKAETGCDGVMIGRATMKNPWIFRQAADLLAGRTPREATAEERRDLMLWHFGQIEATARDEREALHKLRTMTGWYTHGFENGKSLRVRISGLETPAAFREAVTEFFDSAALSGNRPSRVIPGNGVGRDYSRVAP
jgi:tRNA-dihydrouridine synthase B